MSLRVNRSQLISLALQDVDDFVNVSSAACGKGHRIAQLTHSTGTLVQRCHSGSFLLLKYPTIADCAWYSSRALNHGSSVARGEDFIASVFTVNVRIVPSDIWLHSVLPHFPQRG